jgi:hypothetical protein
MRRKSAVLAAIEKGSKAIVEDGEIIVKVVSAWTEVA